MPPQNTAIVSPCGSPPAKTFTPGRGANIWKPPRKSPPDCIRSASARAITSRSVRKRAPSFISPTRAFSLTAPWPRLLYPSYPPEDLKRTIAMADAKALFVEDPKMFAKLKDAPVVHFILLTGEAEGALSLGVLRELGRDAGSAPPISGRTTTPSST